MTPQQDRRALIAASAVAQRPIRQWLSGCNADFFSDYNVAAAAVRRRTYAVVIVGLQFAESRMFDFIREVREIRPNLRIVGVIGTRGQLREASRRSVQAALETIGVEGLLDFTKDPLSEADTDKIRAIAAECRRRR